MDVLWVGLSSKTDKNNKLVTPLDSKTTSGKLISEIENDLVKVEFKKTNLVSFAPLDKNGKLRYPTNDECEMFFPQLQKTISEVQPKLICLLGQKVTNFVMRKLFVRNCTYILNEYKFYSYKKLFILPIYHPSYIMVYKKQYKEDYVDAIKKIINEIMEHEIY
ncbi:uracil-DNA glycosylase family protein [Anabaena sp. UHCC 0204]|uniref:uracil-DNA glycosylase family protein n=1 Tax=Anabaena sp. UHCC 0204 TaxID=2590009 RepID=UPI0014488F8D|nr:uracil-DNA glycosylase family protein [Anabaena sp. UHCC 0204]MTJ10093.1 hypothetical protein [Anabaena sp. UHCC 0204]